MSSVRLTGTPNFLSAISRDVGAFRAGTSARLDRLGADMSALRADVRALTIRFGRDHAVVFDTRADAREFQDRVAALEGKQT